MKPVKIVLVGNETIFLEGLSAVLRRHFQPDAVLCSRSPAEVLEHNPDFAHPDVVVLGKDFFNNSICASIKKTQELLPDAKIAVFLPPNSVDDPVDVLKSGALACLSRNTELSDFITCIDLILNGRIIVSSDFTGKFFQSLAKKKSVTPQKTVLSHREIEIIRLLAQGHTNRQISSSLCVSENTIKVHVKHILSKTQCRNRQQLAFFTTLGKWLAA